VSSTLSDEHTASTKSSCCDEHAHHAAHAHHEEHAHHDELLSASDEHGLHDAHVNLVNSALHMSPAWYRRTLRRAVDSCAALAVLAQVAGNSSEKLEESLQGLKIALAVVQARL
jgi:hypothetical protein